MLDMNVVLQELEAQLRIVNGALTALTGHSYHHEKKRGRKRWTAAEKKALSLKIKTRWAERKKGKKVKK